MNFGDAIKKARVNKNLTQKDLADKLNVTITHISYIENNRRNPSSEFLSRLCKILNVPKEVLLWDAIVPDDLPITPEQFDIVISAKKIVGAFYESESYSGEA